MPKSHKRWTSYELMLKRVKKRPHYIADSWFYDPIKDWFLKTTLCPDYRHPVTIAAYREIRATNREWWAEVHEAVLALAMMFHPRLGENSLWHDLPEAVIMRMIVCRNIPISCTLYTPGPRDDANND